MQKLYELSAKDAAAEFGEPVPADEDDAGLFTTEDQEISGLGVEAVVFNDEEEENTITSLLNALNNADNADMAEALERERRDREAYLREEEERYRERLASAEEDYNRKRYEAEQAAKRERLAREEEERRQEEEEERLAREATLMGRIGKLFKKKPKPEKVEKEAVRETPEPEKPEEVIEMPTVAEEEKEAVFAAAPAEEVSAAVETEPSYDYDLSEEDEQEEEKIEAETPQSEAIDVPEPVAEQSRQDSVSEADTSRQKKPEKKEKPAKPVKEKPVKEKKEKPVKEKKEKPEKKSVLSFFTKKEPEKRPEAVVSAVSVQEPEEPDWKYIALHDEPTGLLNSRAYHDTIKKIPNTVAVVFFDVNHLKYVNDNFSHQEGDKLLKDCAVAIQRHFGEDRVYRIGGDEFVAILPEAKNLTDTITDLSAKVHKNLQEDFKKSEKHIPHAVSIGYAIGDGEHTVEEITKAADAMMYRNKKAYKLAHPEYYSRGEQATPAAPKAKVEKDHDELLPRDQQSLKEKIKNKHQMPTAISTKNLIREIQKKAGEVHAILIASPTFDHLFIIRNVDEFIHLVLEQEAVIDYSYLYVVWDGGSQYYGADEYYNEVTDIFKEIAEGLVSGKFKSEKDVRSVKGLNIFRHVYL